VWLDGANLIMLSINLDAFALKVLVAAGGKIST
jgi:hypothetical protein